MAADRSTLLYRRNLMKGKSKWLAEEQFLDFSFGVVLALLRVGERTSPGWSTESLEVLQREG